MSDNDDALVAGLRKSKQTRTYGYGLNQPRPTTVLEIDAAERIESLTTDRDKWRKIAGEMAGNLGRIKESSNIVARGKGSFSDMLQTAAGYWQEKKHGSLPRDMVESWLDCIHEDAAAALTTYRTGESE